jgi:hypothetical protein
MIIVSITDPLTFCGALAFSIRVSSDQSGAECQKVTAAIVPSGDGAAAASAGVDEVKTNSVAKGGDTTDSS